MSSPGTVSIIIPCYNLGLYLGETVASIEAARTRNLLEVIIVDDGSTDPGTIRVLKDLQANGYRVMRQPNRGVSAARNTAIRAATGKYILPVDSDNKIRQTYLTDAVQLLDADTSVGVVYGDAEFCGDKSGRWEVEKFSLPQLIRRNYIDSCAVYRKELWEQLEGYDERMPFFGWEDWDFWLRAALKGWRFVHLPKVAFDYRVRSGSLLRQADQHSAVIDEYMFSKMEFATIAPLRADLHRLWIIEQSLEYRLAKGLLRPVRFALARLRRRRKQEKVNSVREPAISPTVQK